MGNIWQPTGSPEPGGPDWIAATGAMGCGLVLFIIAKVAFITLLMWL